MRRVLMFSIIALMLVASTASAGMYASLRMTGNGNYDPISTLAGLGSRYYGGLVTDTGMFSNKELSIGFGETIQGEISIGYDSFKYTWDTEEVGRGDDTLTLSVMKLGIAGFYPMKVTDNAKVDVGLRFQYISGKIDEAYDYYRSDYEDTYKISGWAVGPVLRLSWMLADGAIGIGPEIYPKYTSMSTEYEWDYDYRGSEDGPDLSGMSIDYSLRMDFYF